MHFDFFTRTRLTSLWYIPSRVFQFKQIGKYNINIRWERISSIDFENTSTSSKQWAICVRIRLRFYVLAVWQAGYGPRAQTWNRPFTFIHLRSRSFVRSVCLFVRPSMSELSIPALSTNGAEQDFSTFTYGVWITNLSNSHVDIKEDNINTTSIHRLQNLNVLLMRSPFPSRIHQVRSIPSPVRRLSGTSKTSALVGKKRAIRRVQSIALVGHPEPRDRCLCVLYVLPSLSVRDRPKCFGQLSRCDIKIPILTPSIFSLILA